MQNDEWVNFIVYNYDKLKIDEDFEYDFTLNVKNVTFYIAKFYSIRVYKNGKYITDFLLSDDQRQKIRKVYFILNDKLQREIINELEGIS